MVAISALTLCPILVCVMTLVSQSPSSGTCHAAPSNPVELVSKLTLHRDPLPQDSPPPPPPHSASSSPGASSSSPSAPSSPHLVKSARLATYSPSCPPEASIHPCTCIYHTPNAQIEEEEEVYELSQAITTPYAEPLVMTSTPVPATSAQTTAASSSSTTVASTPITTTKEPAASTTTPTESTTRVTESTTSTTTTTMRPVMQSQQQQTGGISATRISVENSASTNDSRVGPDLNSLLDTAAEQKDVGNNPKVNENNISEADESGGGARNTSTTATPNTTTTPQLGLESVHGQQEVATLVAQPATISTSTKPAAAAGATNAQPENNGQASASGSAASSISSSAAAAALNETRQQDYNAVLVNESTNSAKRPSETQPTSPPPPPPPPTANNTMPLHELTPTTGAPKPSGDERLDASPPAAPSPSPLVAPPSPSAPVPDRPDVTLNTSMVASGSSSSSSYTVAPAAVVSSSPISVTDQSSGASALATAEAFVVASAPAISGSPKDVTRQQSSGARDEAVVESRQQQQQNSHTTSGNQLSASAQPVQQSAASSPVPATPPHNSSSTSAEPRAEQTSALPMPTTPSPIPLVQGHHANNGTHLASDKSHNGNSSAPRAPGEHPPSDGRAIHHTHQGSGANITTSSATAAAAQKAVENNLKVDENRISEANESGRGARNTGTTATPTTPQPGPESVHGKQEVATLAARPATITASTKPAAAAAAGATNAQLENNGQAPASGSAASSISSSAAAAALNETRQQDYNAVLVNESTNSAKRPSETQPPNANDTMPLHELTPATGAPKPRGDERLDASPPAAPSPSPLVAPPSPSAPVPDRLVVTLNTSMVASGSSSYTVAPAAAVSSSPISVTNQSSGASALAISGLPQDAARQQSSGARDEAVVESRQQQQQNSHTTSGNQLSASAQPVQQSAASSPVPATPLHNSGGTSAEPRAEQTSALPMPTTPSPLPLVQGHHANNGTHRASDKSDHNGNSSAPRAPGERPPSAGRAIHHTHLGSGTNITSSAPAVAAATSPRHPNGAQPSQAKPQANNQHQHHQSYAANGRQMLTPIAHKPKQPTSRPAAQPRNNHQINQQNNNSSGQHNPQSDSNNTSTSSLGAQEPGGRARDTSQTGTGAARQRAAGAAAFSASSASPPLIRSTRSAGRAAAAQDRLQAAHSGHRSRHQQYHHLTPNTQANRRAGARLNQTREASHQVVVTSAPHLDEQFTNTSQAMASSQRAPGGRRLTRFLAHEQSPSGNLLSDPFADSGEQRVEVVAYCRNIQNTQVLRSAIKGFRGHQVNYFVIDSCKVPPFPNDLFHSIDVRWLEMSNSTVQFHNNFLHGAHQSHQSALATH